MSATVASMVLVRWMRRQQGVRQRRTVFAAMGDMESVSRCRSFAAVERVCQECTQRFCHTGRVPGDEEWVARDCESALTVQDGSPPWVHLLLDFCMILLYSSTEYGNLHLYDVQ